MFLQSIRFSAFVGLLAALITGRRQAADDSSKTRFRSALAHRLTRQKVDFILRRPRRLSNLNNALCILC